MTTGLIILIAISVILLVIAGFFIWSEFDDIYGGDGSVGCAGLFIVICLTIIWIVYALLRTIISAFT